MKTLMMPFAADMNSTAIATAIQMIKDEEKPRGMVGDSASRFLTIEYAAGGPYEETAFLMAGPLLKEGYGVKLAPVGLFAGTSKWAVSTENVRVVNKGV